MGVMRASSGLLNFDHCWEELHKYNNWKLKVGPVEATKYSIDNTERADWVISKEKLYLLIINLVNNDDYPKTYCRNQPYSNY